ncbi:uncharacterized protein LOC123272121 [Cotesia glomerata]|uniref:Uncharacterized protein n=1 Tax=Cotesia glomerata TaxID=32391 RepID=A0AAV7IVL1_COTGL|nr:uncharacterized protein LOC123272121 [Cotesia glomerata]KAH0558137.1 hypothetical protein KQX54_014591 [Cotesia glomerata]
MTKSSGKCGCTKCARRKRKKEVKSVITEEMAYQHQDKMAPTVEENKINLETGQVNNLNEEEYSHLGDYRKLQQTDLTERAWWTDMTHRVYMPPLMLQKPSSKPTRSECSSATSGFRSARPETPDPPSSSSSLISDASEYKSCLSSIISEEIPENLKTKPELPVVRSKSQPLGHQPSPKELRELQMIASKRKKTQIKKRPVCRTTSHATDSFSNCVKCSRIVSRPFKKMQHQFPGNY